MILETKFTETFPFWVQQVVHEFQIPGDSVATYVVSVRALHQEGISVAG